MDRLNAYKNAGYTVIPITAEKVRSVDTLDNIMKFVRKELNLYYAGSRLDKYYLKRKETFKKIFKY